MGRVSRGLRLLVFLCGCGVVNLVAPQHTFVLGLNTQFQRRRTQQQRSCRGALHPRVLRAAAAGEEIDGLVLEEPLGSGRFGTTWRARVARPDAAKIPNELVDQAVAVKLIRLEDGWSSFDSFEREAKVLQRLDHPAIPRYLGTVKNERSDGQDLGLVTQLVNGASLDELVKSGRWQADPDNVRVLAQTLLEVCEHLSKFLPPVVHRDIKPANVVLEANPGGTSPRWKVFLVDFGAALLGGMSSFTKTAASAVGTFGFMAPESFGRVFTPQSDLYGVGATLLFAATGQDPGTFPQERLQIRFRDALVGSVWERDEPWLAELLDKLLAPIPEDRFASASDALRFMSSGSSASEQEVLEPPRGSQLQAMRRGKTLRILFPPPRKEGSISSSVFGVAWTAFTAFWTASVFTAGAPIMALFSLPFWGAGFGVLKESFGLLLKGSRELSVDPDSWSLGEATMSDSALAWLRRDQRASQGEGSVSRKPFVDGKTSDLQFLVNYPPGSSLTLKEGLLEVQVGEGLAEVDHSLQGPVVISIFA